MKQLLLLFACFSLTIRLVSADCDEIHSSKGPTRGSRYKVEVYYRDKEHSTSGTKRVKSFGFSVTIQPKVGSQ
jgi:hypothetical protein